jgi:hypothetical protein
MNPLRKVKRQSADGSLTEIDFLEIKAGDKFRLYEFDSITPGDENGETLYIAIEDAHPLEGSYAAVVVNPFTETVGPHSVVWEIPNP